MLPRSFFVRVVVLCAGLLMVTVLLLSFNRDQEREQRETATETPRRSSLLPSSGFKKFAGTDACMTCHPNQHDSYLHTAHSRAMSLVIPENEPGDGTFEHQRSNRAYSTKRLDGALWHAESILQLAATPTKAIEEADIVGTIHELKYLVGSGRHSRTYLTEEEGFLLESPLTWYQSTGRWNMSPGYDHPEQEGFERAADTGCLFCHVGQMERIAGSTSRLKIAEPAIGCERCHGSGTEHIRKWQGMPVATLESTAEKSDSTIVNPGKLSQHLAEAICAQCHLRGDATVVVRGKRLMDFEPGSSLSSVRIDYRLETDDDTMKVVGHVDQMRASRCFQQSQTLTCTTCHDMHSDVSNSPPTVEYFRQRCIDCHSSQGCSIDSTERTRVAPGDSCVQCHMPQVATDIPHIAFTHHRIGVHKPADSRPPGPAPPGPTPASSVTVGKLTPFDETLSVSTVEANRNLGLAYAELANKQADFGLAQVYRERAKELLASVAATSSSDGDVYAALARFSWDEGTPEAVLQLASQAMEDPQLSDHALMDCLMVAGDSLLQMRRSKEAVPHFEKLVTLRRRSQDWLLLGIAKFQSGETDAGIEAMQHAIRIQPLRGDIHLTLSEMFLSLGQTANSARHREIGKRLEASP